MPQKQAWEKTCPERVKRRLIACSKGNLKVEGQNDPTRFVVIDHHSTKFQCCVGNPHRCSCSASQPCIHILCILTTVFRIAATNAALWQKGVSELELSGWIVTRSDSERCLFCREAVAVDNHCEHCGICFHERCLQLAFSARKCLYGVCPKCQEKLPVKKQCAVLHCENCHRPCQDDYYRCLLCDKYCICPQCFRSANTHSFHPFSYETKGAPTKPPALSDAMKVEELQYREINPEDYNVLLSLDGDNSKRVPPHVLSSLPLAKYDGCGSFNQTCPICQQSYAARDLCLVLLCGHTMHRECGRRWLSQYSNECPIDHIAITEVNQGTRHPPSVGKSLNPTGTRSSRVLNQKLAVKAPFLPPIRSKK
jgi:E3 ubiquitin-protein ligase ZSWIM2